MEVVKPVKRNVLLNPGPATTTDTVKYAQVIPDICPREKEFVDIMNEVRAELTKVVHADPKKYTSVLFTGSGTVIQDVLVNSLVPAGKKILVVNNGAYSARMVEIAKYYHIPCVDLKFPATGLPDLKVVKEALAGDRDIAVVATTHHETGTGVLNPVGEIGKMAHDHGCIFIADTISTYGLLPIDMEKENIDFLHVIGAEGPRGHDGRLLGRRPDRRDRQVQGLPHALLLLQPVHAVRLLRAGGRDALHPAGADRLLPSPGHQGVLAGG